MGRSPPLAATVVALAAGAALVAGIGSAGGAPVGGGAHAEYPWPKRIAAAERFADRRAGRISFAVVDEAGRLRGDHLHRVHNSASVVKVMLMVALLREPGVRHDALTRSEKHLLGPMIRRSDNAAANAIYARVGPGSLRHLARDAGMRGFTTQAVWGLSTITAAGQARFFHRLEEFVPRRHRGYALHLLTRIVGAQRWGIPPAAPRGWRLHFKGGWSGAPSWRVNQVMLLRRPPRRLALAILTREQPSMRYGELSIEGVAARLLRRYNRFSR